MMSDLHSAYLKAMGIDVWLERQPSQSDIVDSDDNSALPEIQKIQNQQIQNKAEVVDVVVAKPTTEAIEEKTEISISELDWQALRSAVEQCQRCDLSQTRRKTIFGTGKQTAALMIIGDAPNDEDEQHGEPFSGAAGKLLTGMLKAMGYQRNDVYISNIVKCRTIEHIDPSEDEAEACEKYLYRQIELVQPQLILALGSITAQRLLKNKSTMGRLRGQLHYIEGINVPVLVSFHPAYLLRAPNEKRKAWDDLQMAMKELATIKTTSLDKK